VSALRRERAAWIAVTAVLAVGLTWTTVALAAVALGARVHCPPGALIAGQVIVRSLALAVRAGGPAALAATAVAGLLAAALLLRGTPRAGGARHVG
jgi:hypothetical protein